MTTQYSHLMEIEQMTTNKEGQSKSAEQKKIFEQFLEHNSISKEWFDESFED